MIRFLVFLLLPMGVAAQSIPLPAFPDGWSVYGGEWRVSGGILSMRGDEDSKVMARGVMARDFQLDVELRVDSADGEAGVIFHGQKFAIGEDDFEGYFAGIDSGRNAIMWEAFDSEKREIASRPVEIEADDWYHLRLRVAGEKVKLYLEQEPITESSWPVFDGIDDAFSNGNIALRVSKGEASFRKLSLREYESETPEETYTNPVQPGCADPVVLLHEGTYYAYTTDTAGRPRGERGIRLYTSDNLRDWKDEGFAVKHEDTWGDHGFWAPDIVEKDGTFYLYYAAEERMCVATADSPMGPFKQKEQAPMEPKSIRIDGHVFEDDDGERYFYYVAFGNGNEIWGGKLNDDMVSVDPSSLKRMIQPDEPWEQHMGKVTEGAEMLKHNGTYYLTYSGSHFKSPEYAVGYATSDSPLGPWKKYRFNPVMKSTAYAHGTAHHCFTTSPDGEEIFIVYHRHFSASKSNPRKLAIDRVRFVPNPDGGPDILQIHGPTSSPQALPSGSGNSNDLSERE